MISIKSTAKNKGRQGAFVLRPPFVRPVQLSLKLKAIKGVLEKITLLERAA